MTLMTQTEEVADAARRRSVPLVAVLVTTSLLLGLVAGAVWAASRPEPMSSPIFSTTDGLPATVVAGREYTAVLTVAVGADWATYPDAPWIGPGDVLGVGATLSYADVDASILCTDTMAPGTAKTLSCPFTVPDAPGPLMLVVGWPLTTSDGAASTRTYDHTIVPAA